MNLLQDRDFYLEASEIEFLVGYGSEDECESWSWMHLLIWAAYEDRL